MLICGIDIGKNQHEASIISGDGHLIGKSLRFTNTTDGGEKLIAYLSAHNPNGENIVIGMEATGHYWLSLYCFLFDKGFQVNVINPIQSDAVRHLFLRKTKTDRKDSFLIAETIRIGRFSNTELADEDLLSMRHLCRHRMQSGGLHCRPEAQNHRCDGSRISRIPNALFRHVWQNLH